MEDTGPVDAASCYDSLDRSARAIRIVTLLPEPHPLDNRIQCKLVAHSLDEKPEYEALSYTWGVPGRYGHKIWVNGHHYIIRQNLLCALQALRETSNRALWIDALCINQRDERERNAQVQMMAEIYRNAKCVLSWLGPADEQHTSPVGNENLDTLSVFLTEKSSRAFSFIRAVARGTQDTSHPFIPIFSNDPKGDANWKSLYHFCEDLEYWRRLWIIQELCLAPKLILCQGRARMDWDEFVSFMAAQISFPEDYWAEHVVQSRLWRLAKIVGKGTGLDIHQALEHCKGSVCLDPKDKIYGILGLVDNASIGNIQVNYRQSLFQTYADVLLSWRQTHQPTSEEFAAFSNHIQQAILSPEYDHLVYLELASGRQRYAASASGEHEFMLGYELGEIIAVSTESKDVLEAHKMCVYRHMPVLSGPLSPGSEAPEPCKYVDWWARHLENCDPTFVDAFPLFESIKTSAGANENIDEGTRNYNHQLREYDKGLTFFVTDKGQVGLAPVGTRAGDLFWGYEWGPHGQDWNSVGTFEAVVRHDGHSLRIVGRARLICCPVAHSDGNCTSCKNSHPLKGGPREDWSFYQAHSRWGNFDRKDLPRLEVSVTLPLLQFLTCPFPHGQQFYNPIHARKHAKYYEELLQSLQKKEWTWPEDNSPERYTGPCNDPWKPAMRESEPDELRASAVMWERHVEKMEKIAIRFLCRTAKEIKQPSPSSNRSRVMDGVSNHDLLTLLGRPSTMHRLGFNANQFRIFYEGAERL